MTDTTTQLAFALHENRGVYALMLGSGLSRSASIPTGWEITLDLIRRVALAEGVEEQEDWAQWYRGQEKAEPDYSALLARMSSSSAERQAILQNYIEPTTEERESGLKVPTPAHRAIARIVAAGVVRVIVTTNFDRLLELALREIGIEPTVISSPDALEGAPPLAHCPCYILKLHGDYKDARILNTDEELAVYPDGYNRLLDRILDEHGLIVCGWSGEWDPALRAAILRAPNRRYGAYWVARGTPTERAAALIEHRGARVIGVQDADSFFVGLQQRLETLTATGAQNPVGIDLQVATAKRYLARHEDRIKLDALIEDELARVHGLLKAGEFTTNSLNDWDEVRRQVAAYEASVETLACLAGALGRWGNGTESRLVFDILRDLHRWQVLSQGGSTVLIGLRAYPAVLVFTAYGVGLVRAERWTTLHELLSLRLPIQYQQETQTAVATWLLDAIQGVPNGVWQQLPDMKDRRTALSDHLLELLDNWRRRFLGLTPEFERDYHLFETLGGVSYAEQIELPDLQAALVAPQHKGIFVPVGRVAWQRDIRRALWTELAGPLKADLLRAGFGRGDSEHYDAALSNVESMANQYGRW